MKAYLFILAATLCAAAFDANGQPMEWQANIDWAAGNTDAGGSVYCPDVYIANGVPQAIVSGGRAEALNQAMVAAYEGDLLRSWTLVLMTQCHNRHAQQMLIQAGQKNVLTYLVRNYTARGVDSQAAISGANFAVSLLNVLE